MGWMKSKFDQDCFATEMSDIQAYIERTGKKIRCPKCREELPMTFFNRSDVHDLEGDITHWMRVHNVRSCNATLTVFND